MGRKPGLPVLYFPTGDTSVYWCRFTINGKRFRFSCGTRDIGTATAEAQRFHAETALGRSASRSRTRRPVASGPLELLVAEYIVGTRANGKAESYVVKQEMHFRAHFLPRWKRLDQVTLPAIEHYKAARVADGIKLTTLYKELVTLSRFLRWCKRQGHLHEVPEFDRFKPTTDYQPPDLTPGQVRTLLAKIPDRHSHHNRYPVREFFTVQWAQAMRPGEVMRLRWHDIDLEKERISIPVLSDKARAGRTIGMAKEAVAVLAEMAKAPHMKTSIIFGRHDYRVSLEKAAKAAKLGHVTAHHLRHARISELASCTRDVAAVQYMAGHKNMATTDLYIRSRTERTEAMLKGLDSDKVTLTKSRSRKRGVG